MKRTRLFMLGAGLVVTLGTLGGCSKSYHIGHRASWHGGSYGTSWHSGYKHYKHHGHYGHHGHHGHYGHGHHRPHCY